MKLAITMVTTRTTTFKLPVVRNWCCMPPYGYAELSPYG
jgi:hypothetical protein